MNPKLFSLCRLAVVCGLFALAPIDANVFANDGGINAAEDKSTEAVSDILLEEVVTESGDVVGFYEPEPGLVLVKTTLTASRIDGKNPSPRAHARNTRSGRIGKTDVAALYFQLTGTTPSGRVAEAFSRVNDDGNGDTNGGRGLWTEPPDDEDFDENGNSHPQDRKLRKSRVGKLSEKEFKDIFCLDTPAPIASCRTKMKNKYTLYTSGYYYVFYQAVYTDNGKVRHKNYFRSCSSCSWQSLGFEDVSKGWYRLIIWESTSPVRFGGVVDSVNGGDKFHIATYAA